MEQTRFKKKKKTSILKSFKDWMSKVIVNMSCVKIFLDYFWTKLHFSHANKQVQPITLLHFPTNALTAQDMHRCWIYNDIEMVTTWNMQAVMIQLQLENGLIQNLCFCLETSGPAHRHLMLTSVHFWGNFFIRFVYTLQQVWIQKNPEVWGVFLLCVMSFILVAVVLLLQHDL